MESQNYFFLTIVYLYAACNLVVTCPWQCACAEGKVNCYGRNLKVIPHDLPKDVVFIDLQTNEIESVQDAFHNMTAVREIHLRYVFAQRPSQRTPFSPYPPPLPTHLQIKVKKKIACI
jgi:hypothetical protein